MYRDDFEKLGKDLEYSKDRDKEKYYKTLEQLLESYHQCGMVDIFSMFLWYILFLIEGGKF